MKNSELIEKLQKLPQEMDVFLCDLDNDEEEIALIHEIVGVDKEFGLVDKHPGQVILINFKSE